MPIRLTCRTNRLSPFYCIESRLNCSCPKWLECSWCWYQPMRNWHVIPWMFTHPSTNPAHHNFTMTRSIVIRHNVILFKCWFNWNRDFQLAVRNYLNSNQIVIMTQTLIWKGISHVPVPVFCLLDIWHLGKFMCVSKYVVMLKYI